MGMRFACPLRCLRKKQQEAVSETEIKVSDPSLGINTLGQLWFLPLSVVQGQVKCSFSSQ